MINENDLPEIQGFRMDRHKLRSNEPAERAVRLWCSDAARKGRKMDALRVWHEANALRHTRGSLRSHCRDEQGVSNCRDPSIALLLLIFATAIAYALFLIWREACILDEAESNPYRADGINRRT